MDPRWDAELGTGGAAPTGEMCTTNWDTVGTVIEIVSPKWVLTVLAELTDGPKRHNELSRAICLDHKRLGRILRRLQKAKIVARKVNVARQPVHVQYQLTRSGNALMTILANLNCWHDIYKPDQSELPRLSR
jgi:DNA-binding HxlR family transcriptional regulator